jgi:hypothetical protein
MKLCTSTIKIRIDCDQTNLLIVQDSYVSEKTKQGLGSLMRLGLCQMTISVLDIFWEIDNVVSSTVTQSEQLSFLVSHVLAIGRTKI